MAKQAFLKFKQVLALLMFKQVLALLKFKKVLALIKLQEEPIWLIIDCEQHLLAFIN